MNEIKAEKIYFNKELYDSILEGKSAALYTIADLKPKKAMRNYGIVLPDDLIIDGIDSGRYYAPDLHLQGLYDHTSESRDYFDCIVEVKPSNFEVYSQFTDEPMHFKKYIERFKIYPLSKKLCFIQLGAPWEGSLYEGHYCVNSGKFGNYFKEGKRYELAVETKLVAGEYGIDEIDLFTFAEDTDRRWVRQRKAYDEIAASYLKRNHYTLHRELNLPHLYKEVYDYEL